MPQIQRFLVGSLLSLVIILGTNTAVAHEGPDPLARWVFDAQAVAENSQRLEARLGPVGKLLGNFQLVNDDDTECLALFGGSTGVEVTADHNAATQYLPEQAVTVAAWVAIQKPERWGGIAGVIQDNGSQESGWLLGYNGSVFTFALRGQTGPQRLTYLEGKTKYEAGKLYHVVAVYDGQTMQLFVNGKLEAESTDQAGPIVYPQRAPFMLGAYRDDNEFQGLHGRLHEIAIYDLAAKTAWVEHDFSHDARLSQLPAQSVEAPLAFVVKPYLQAGTQTSMTVMWRTNRAGTSVLHYGENDKCEQSIPVEKKAELHEVKIEGLKPETQYFYRTETNVEGSPPLLSTAYTFQTAVKDTTPFAFAVISDTQGNPTVSGKLANFAWGQRPSFLLHSGDLVSTGPNHNHWTEHFFPGMEPLIQHVPFYPVLGNHEQNAKYYFDYVSLPDPEFFYQFRYGKTDFFMIDSNRNVQPGSQQYQWLNAMLALSDADWKFVCHHHPPYSSDENDYGNLWKTNQSTRGDLRARKLVPLYEKHGVDIVWNGHIHSYERTWPIRENRAVEADGPIYMITGGGGGGLETPGPIRPFFQNTVRHGHHYLMVRINGKTLEMQVYDLENRLFDQLVIKK